MRLRIAAAALAAMLGALASTQATIGQNVSDIVDPWNRATPWNMARAFAEMERLRAEIRLLNGLAGAQAALLALNRERAESGAGPAVLDARLCADPALAPWCRVLPETFGEGAASAVDDGEPEAKP